LGEVRRRTKVMGRFPGETSCLSLVWAVLDLFFSHASKHATFTDVDRQHLYRIKYRQIDPDTRRGGHSRLNSPLGTSPARESTAVNGRDRSAGLVPCLRGLQALSRESWAI